MATFKSFLSAVGNEAATVFKWLASPQGQTEVAVVETSAAAVTTAINPAAGAALVAIEGLINVALKQVISIEAVAAAAAQQSGTGAQKAAAAAVAVAPQISATLQSLGVKNPTSDQVQTIATVVSASIANIVNAFPPHTA